MDMDDMMDIGIRAANYYMMARFSIQDKKFKEAALFYELAAHDYEALAKSQANPADKIAFRLAQKECLQFTYINARDDPAAWKANEAKLKDISDEIRLLESRGAIQ